MRFRYPADGNDLAALARRGGSVGRVAGKLSS